MPDIEEIVGDPDPTPTPTPTPVVRNIKTVADRIRALDENDTPISGLNLRTIASAIRHSKSTTGQTVATALNTNDNDGGIVITPGIPSPGSSGMPILP